MSGSSGGGWKKSEGRDTPNFYSDSEKRGVRKYLLLLQDSIAIKFVLEKPDKSDLFHSSESCSRRRGHQEVFCFPRATQNVHKSQPEHHGFALFQSFREANLQCYWNPSVVVAFEKLEYAGFISPSTIFVSTLRKFLHVLRSAWSRQMIRSPPGYRIEFMGDVDELVCEPIQRSHFSPLSDSLCWAISDLTSRGEEAFLESICGDLEQSFPWMVQPNVELVYKTLDKLTEEKKIYQTARGYFIVTPDTLRYMTRRVRDRRNREEHAPYCSSVPRRPSSVVALTPQQPELPRPRQRNSVAIVEYRPSVFESEFKRDEDDLAKGCQSTSRTSSRPPPPARLTRHNSLKIFRRRDYAAPEQSNQPIFGARSLSFRFSRPKPTAAVVSESSVESSPPNSGSDLGEEAAQPAKKEAKEGFLRKFFGLRSFNRGKREKKKENKRSKDVLEISSLPRRPQRFYDDDDEDVHHHAHDNDENHLESPCCSMDSRVVIKSSDELELKGRPRWNSLPKQQRSYRAGSGHSIMTLLDDNSPLYATASSLIHQGRNEGSGGGAQSSRSSTLSQATSLGYGSQGPQSFATSTTTPTTGPSHSPCPSLSTTASGHGNYAPLAQTGKSWRRECSKEKTLSSSSSNKSSQQPKVYSDVYRAKDALCGNYLSRRSSSPMPLTNSGSSSGMDGKKAIYETIRDDHPHRVGGGGGGKRASIGCVDGNKISKTLANATITHNMESRNNLSVELLLGGKRTDDGESINVSIGGTHIRLPKHAPPTFAQLKTSLNDKGQLETCLDCTDPHHNNNSQTISSKVELQTQNNKLSAPPPSSSSFNNNNNNNPANVKAFEHAQHQVPPPPQLLTS